MQYRKAAGVCIIAACIAIGTAVVLTPRVPPGTNSIASSQPVNAGAESPHIQPHIAVAPETRPPEPAVRPEPRSDPALRRTVPRQLPPFATTRSRYRSRQYCPADFNHDNVVDEADLAAYMESWQAGDETPVRRADMNRDGIVDGVDMSEFLSVYFNNDCDPLRQNERRLVTRLDRATGASLRDRAAPRQTLEAP